MTTERTHYVTTTDGVAIGGTVHGQGPALVFLHGAVGDGDLDWQQVAETLADRYTCYLPSLRGRGLSDDHPNLRTSRIVEDFASYVKSVGEPAGVVGWSGGAYFALGVAETCPDSVAAVAPIEPVFLAVLNAAEKGVVGTAVAAMGQLEATGDWAAAVHAFLGWPFSEHDIAVAEETGYVEAAARYVPHLLKMFQQVMEKDDHAVEDPATLATIAAPVLVLMGSSTRPSFRDCAKYVVAHVPHARIQELVGAAHALPLTHPAELAEKLAAFFEPAMPPTG